MRNLTIQALQSEAKDFAQRESAHWESALFGVTDGKAIGTYLEHKFQAFLARRYRFAQSSSAKGIDFPRLAVDIKVTSLKQPQSSCPFTSARQKVYGLGYSLLVFVYAKEDAPRKKSARLDIRHVIFVQASQTADFQTSSGILKILGNNGNADDLVAFMEERCLPLDEIQARSLAEEILATPPQPGVLTISNALQWRLQYARAIELAGRMEGVLRLT